MSPITFQDTFAYGPILQCLTEHMPFATIRNLQLTCTSYSALYSYALPSKWNIDTHLSRWMQHPKDFRCTLDECQAVISGSAALQFFDAPTSWSPNNINVYVAGKDKSQPARLHNHLVTVQDYTLQKTETVAPCEEVSWPQCLEIREYTTFSPSTREVEKLRLVIFGEDVQQGGEYDYNVDDPLHSILSEEAHSTAMLNFMTGREAFSLYPKSTFIDRKNFPCQPHNCVRARHDQYSDYGFALSEIRPRVEARQSSHPVRKARAFGDKYCWTIAYGADGVGKPQTVARQKAPMSASTMWWSMREDAEHLCYPKDERYKFRVTAHWYPIRFHGLMDTSQKIFTYQALQGLSANHPVHCVPEWRLETTGIANQAVFCNCKHAVVSGRFGCRCCDSMRCEDPLSAHRIENVGSYTPAADLLRTATGGEHEIEEEEFMDWAIKKVEHDRYFQLTWDAMDHSRR